MRKGNSNSASLFMAVTYSPTIESSENPSSSVSLTILQLRRGNSIGLEITLYMQSMFKNFMAFNLLLSVIRGSRFIWSCVMFLNNACIVDSSFRTCARLTSDGNTSPKLDKIMRQLLLASSNFEEDAKSFTSKLEAFKVSSNVLARDKSSFKQLVNLAMSPCT